MTNSVGITQVNDASIVACAPIMSVALLAVALGVIAYLIFQKREPEAVMIQSAWRGERPVLARGDLHARTRSTYDHFLARDRARRLSVGPAGNARLSAGGHFLGHRLTLREHARDDFPADPTNDTAVNARARLGTKGGCAAYGPRREPS